MTPDKIKELRQSMGLTQEQLAKLIGVSAVTVNRWERGKTQPSPMCMSALLKLEEERRGLVSTSS